MVAVVKGHFQQAFIPARRPNEHENYLQYRRDTFGRIGGSAGHVMVTMGSGKTDDIKTGIPPKMKPEALDRWNRARDEIAIERMFR